MKITIVDKEWHEIREIWGKTFSSVGKDTGTMKTEIILNTGQYRVNIMLLP